MTNDKEKIPAEAAKYISRLTADRKKLKDQCFKQFDVDSFYDLQWSNVIDLLSNLEGKFNEHTIEIFCQYLDKE